MAKQQQREREGEEGKRMEWILAIKFYYAFIGCYII
jgi:hypothetical protein